MDDGSDNPFMMGDPLHDLTGGREDSPGGARGEERMTVEVGASGPRSRGGGWSSSAFNGQVDTVDATPLAPPSLLLLSLLSSTIAEEDVAGGVLLFADADLDAVPADKEDIVNADNNGAMVAAVIAMPDTTGGDGARMAIALELLSSTQRALIVISLVMNTFFLVLMM